MTSRTLVPDLTHGIGEKRRHLAHEVEHVSHILPGQGPIETFVHHNTLHGLQHLPFEEALAEASRIFGARGYLPLEEFRRLYSVGRITAEDIEIVLADRYPDAGSEVIARAGDQSITALDVKRAALIYGLEAMLPEELEWRLLEEKALTRLRADVPAPIRRRLLAKAGIDLRADLARVGDGWTLSDFVRTTLGIDLPARARAEAFEEARREGEGAGAGAGAAEVSSLLASLDIPEGKRAGYLERVDAILGEATHRARAGFLRAEARHTKRIFRLFFDARGTLSNLARRLQEDVEAYAVTALYHASLASLDLRDPLSPIDPATLEERDPVHGAGEALLEELRHMERWGGPPIPVTPGLRAEIEAVVAAAATRSDAAESIHATASAEIGRLGRIVLQGLDGAALNRRGAEALGALISLDDDPARYSDLLAALARRDPRAHMQAHAEELLARTFDGVGSEASHRDILLALTGEDIHQTVHAYLVRVLAAFFDEGLAVWKMAGRSLGFYDAWRSLAAHDPSFRMAELPGFHEALLKLPPLAVDAVLQSLARLGVEEERAALYLQKLLVALPGFSGMARWRQDHPGYAAQAVNPIDILELLAVRLFHESLLVRRLCRATWNVDGAVASLRHYFEAHLAELYVRRELFGGRLPELLAERAQSLVSGRAVRGGGSEDPWEALADMIWAYQSRVRAEGGEAGAEDARAAQPRAIRLFHLASHLGISAGELRVMPRAEKERLLAALEAFPEEAHSPVWQDAYEIHYRDKVLFALAQNHARASKIQIQKTSGRAEAQVAFCIDDREEAIRRHIEELNPKIETFGVAGFFGVPMMFQAFGAEDAVPLCPIVVTPTNRVVEVARPDAQEILTTYQRSSRRVEAISRASDEASRNVVASFFLVNLVGLLTAIPLLGKVFFPRIFEALSRRAARAIVPEVPTAVEITAPSGAPPGTAAAPRVGFTLEEQADRVRGTLRTLGLTKGFAPFVVLMGHGSGSVNNPHLSAYDCGACGGKHGGPSARVFAKMANTPEVRENLRSRGIDIPDDTWFIGAEHNTCTDIITYFDLDDLPKAHEEAFQRFLADMDHACALSAHERCRRFASAPKDPTPSRARKHVISRSVDMSQARPELGHVTNASAIIGRRSMTSGVFLDRRAFLVSYDPTSDPEGAILENILLAVGPVGAGINLEYYFSTVDNAKYGCGTKIPHNVCGLIGVMEGVQSDLRTGLPRQMIEIHEAMRLQIIVEAAPEVLGAIYARQAPLRELIGWVRPLVSLHAASPRGQRLASVVPRQDRFCIPSAHHAAPRGEGERSAKEREEGGPCLRY
jgi:hypothetical protein